MLQVLGITHKKWKTQLSILDNTQQHNHGFAKHLNENRNGVQEQGKGHKG